MLPKLNRLAQVFIISAASFIFAIAVEEAVATELTGSINADPHSVTQQQAPPIFALERVYPGTDGALKEFGSARSDHAAIALDIGQCYYEKIGDPIHWSPSVKAILLFELDKNLMHSIPDPDSARKDESSAHGLLVLNPFHAAAISFSDRISRDRLEVRRELEDSRLRSTVYQSFILVLGAFATILVSIRSIMKDGARLSNAVGVLAIVCSAAGTAISSMSAFDGSQSVALRDQRTLAQLQQLHWRVASDVLTRPELCKDHIAVPADAMEMVASWRSRLEAIRDNAVETIARPGDLSTGKALNATLSEKGGQAPGPVANR